MPSVSWLLLLLLGSSPGTASPYTGNSTSEPSEEQHAGTGYKNESD